MLSLQQITPMRPDIPVTEDSKRRAREAQLDERARVTAETGVRFDGDRPYLPTPTPTYDPAKHAEQMRQVEAIETLTVIVRQYGAPRVMTWLRNIAAVGGGR